MLVVISGKEPLAGIEVSLAFSRIEQAKSSICSFGISSSLTAYRNIPIKENLARFEELEDFFVINREI